MIILQIIKWKISLSFKTGKIVVKMDVRKWEREREREYSNASIACQKIIYLEGESVKDVSRLSNIFPPPYVN